MFDLTGKTALVTGATQGIGFEIARLLASHGAKVFINGASSDEKCRAASEKIPNSTPVRADLTNAAERATLYEKTGGVDILVLNASVQYKRAWDGFTEEEYDAAVSYLDFLGIQNGFTQDFCAATEDYIPDFSLEGLE